MHLHDHSQDLRGIFLYHRHMQLADAECPDRFLLPLGAVYRAFDLCDPDLCHVLILSALLNAATN